MMCVTKAHKGFEGVEESVHCLQSLQVAFIVSN